MIAFDHDLIDHRGQLAGRRDAARPGQVGIAHAPGGVAHKLAQDAQGLNTLLWELQQW
jgi:hypothetical protein